MRNVSRLILMIFLVDMMAVTPVWAQYPETRKTDHTDRYFGTEVADPYHWLEQDKNAETTDWVKRQNAFTQDYLAKIPFRSQLRQKLETIQHFTQYKDAFIHGNYYYFYRNDGLQNQFVLYRQKGKDGQPEVFLDPNTFSEDGTVALSALSISGDGKYCAYSISKKGSDWSEAYVMEIEGRKLLNEKLKWLKFSGLSWYKNEGFYYSRYPVPNKEQASGAQIKLHSVYYHKVGAPQSADELIYQDTAHPARYHVGKVTPDNRFLLMYIMDGTEGVQIMLRDLRKKKKQSFKMILAGFEHDGEIIDNDDKYLYLRTNVSAPNYRVVAASIINPFVNNYETMIPESKDFLQSVKAIGGDWFASYLHNASSKLVHFRAGGFKVKDIEIPTAGTVVAFDGKPGDKELLYAYSSFTQPTVLYSYDIRKEKSSILKKPETSFNPGEYETKLVFFPNRDAIQIPLYISYKKGTQLDGNNPLLLHGYGGFNVPQTPGFKTPDLFFMSQGGIYVQACLRGGSEFGDAWHKAGMLYGKQNVFNDFMDAAKWLIDQKYTNSEKLAIHGWSNGGLLIGACITQKPELFKVALPDAGVLDMLRYQKFTVGAGWVPEYGSSDDVLQFDNLYAYSPVHNIKPGKKYPATFITVADHDDRVVPMHSYKFAARLQECQADDEPILIRIEEGAGHSEGKPVTKLLDEWADVLSFTMYHLGMPLK
jgi:prolyl oligopeptidase